ncbi:MAG: pyridoxamine 5'-phosphate oxidase [Nevskiaceae bacterium]|nr:MAG: pyridoxamine 5'-phosphate oxidase [Nevskiaceae bacterium]TBR73250.1 MAG: pyridoxamine 5'-phosphate oxidase [Nevskiaceae bacterium]
MTIPGWTRAESPFHDGEVAVHDRLGIHAVIEARVRRAGIRDYLLDQHREFFPMLPFMLVGRLDAQGWPWATLRVGRPGFVTSPDAHTLHFGGRSLPGDPCGAFHAGEALGTLGIQLHTGRRNRANGTVTAADGTGFTLAVNQSFGNCHKYIQARIPEWCERGTKESVAEASGLSMADRDLLSAADTFFIASAWLGGDAGIARGVDVSHKGGWPGFVRVEDAQTLTVPDFVGNSYFNTLGNLMLDPRAGLLFIDFAAGDLVYVAARAEILWDGPQTEWPRGTQRLVRFHVQRVRRAAGVVPFTWSAAEYSPALGTTGVWSVPCANADA